MSRYRKRLNWTPMTDGRQQANVTINGVDYIARTIPNSMLHPDRWSWEIYSTTPDLDTVVGRGVARGATGRERAVTAVRNRLGEIEQEHWT